MRLKIIAGLFLACYLISALSAECYIVEHLSGYAAKNYSNLAFEDDGISKGRFVVYIDGDMSNVVGSNLSKFFALSSNSILGISAEGTKSVAETWTMFPAQKKASYTKSVSGWGGADGVSAFIGDITERCTTNK